MEFIRETIMLIMQPPWKHGRFLFTPALLPEFILANSPAQECKEVMGMDPEPSSRYISDLCWRSGLRIRLCPYYLLHGFG